MNKYNSAIKNPAFLAAFKGKHIKVVAPASGKAENINSLLALPLNIEISPNTFGNHIVYHANSDEERFKQLTDALYCSSSSIIWTLRGGYGSARLIDKLSQLTPPTQKKIFIGFSDVTALHLFLSQKWHWQPIHGAGFMQLLDTEKDPLNFIKIAEIIARKTTIQSFENLQPLNNYARQIEKISGSITGGNLTLVENSIGTTWQIDTKNKIVFLEEINEKGYRIDRTLFHLQQAYLFKEAKAIVFGDCFKIDDQESIQAALTRFADEVNLPVYQTKEFGHGRKNYPFIYNSKAVINYDQQSNYMMQINI